MTTKTALAFVLLVLLAGIGLAASSHASAASIDVSAIAKATKAASIVHQVPCQMRRHCDWRGCRKVRRCW